MKKKIGLIIILLFLLLNINLFLFLPVFVGLTFETVGELALGVAIITSSALAGAVGSYAIATSKPKVVLLPPVRIENVRSLETSKDVLERVIADTNTLPTFTEHFTMLLKQIKKYGRRETSVYECLAENFERDGLTFRTIDGTLSELKKLFESNTLSIINRVRAFDDEEYREMQLAINSGTALAKAAYGSVGERRMKLYQGYIDFVNAAIAKNEEILLKLDEFQSELTNLQVYSVEEVENLQAMKDMTSLTKDINLYK